MSESSLDNRNPQDLCRALAQADDVVFHTYIDGLKELKIIDPSFINADEYIALYKINRIIYDKDENNLEKLGNLYHMAYAQNMNLFLLINSDGQKVDLYLGVHEEDQSDLNAHKTALENGFKGNFPGSKGEDLETVTLNENQKTGIKTVMGNCFSDKAAVSIVSGIASKRGEKEEKNQEFVQGLEKLIDSMDGVAFTGVVIADSVSKDKLLAIRSELESLYSTLQPFAKTTMSFNKSTSESITNTLNWGMTQSEGNSTSTTLTVGTLESRTKNKGIMGGSSVNLGKAIMKGISGGISAGMLSAMGTVSKTVSKMLGFNAGVQMGSAVTTGEHRDSANMSGQHHETAKQEGSAKSEGTTNTSGNDLQIEYENKKIAQMLEQIDLQLKRSRECESAGIFAVAAYFLADNSANSARVASNYKSLISGDKTSMETSNISTWDKSDEVEKLVKYLKRLYHPEFELVSGEFKTNTTAVSMVSGKELAIQMGLPKKSITGVTVSECASFGRNIYRLFDEAKNGKIEIGNIYHMCENEATRVELNVNDLTMHTFVTGATGSGKSNAIYTLVRSLLDKKVKFLVVEPAKGEYKDVFGGREDVQVYGTNYKKMQLLHLNPFSFPEDVHVLEHIDRLIEIFNACWPMYAAMPAVLKDAIEQAYRKVGWDLTTSDCYPLVFPTFENVLEELAEIINKSAFSSDTKGDYTGALITRVKSLTNGINGQILCSGAEISNEELFDRNVIVDLSRVGSVETKSLLMGILVLKLQEYRMSQGGENTSLKHVTVLEEAHHLLKKTSGVQMQESSNLQGKSVEMIANAIAEMRTYGEGFVIADQAPGLMDESVIRNTNTKIIFRLPDQSDRKLMGGSAALNESQTMEIAKLEKGVAVIYQNDWLEAVLCKIDKYTDDRKQRFSYKGKVNTDIIRKKMLDCIMKKEIYNEGDRIDIQELREAVIQSNLDISIKRDLEEYLSAKEEETVKALRKLLYDFFHADIAFVKAQKCNNLDDWIHVFTETLRPSLNKNNYSDEQIHLVVNMLICEQSLRDISYNDLLCRYRELYEEQGGVF